MAKKEGKSTVPDYTTNKDSLNSSYVSVIDSIDPMDTDGANINNQNINLKDAKVVFDDNAHLTFKEKIIDFIRSRNKKMVALIGGIIFGILLIIGIVFLVISHIDSGYKAKVVIPDIVYMGENANVLVVAEGRRNLENTVTSFEAYYDTQDVNDENNIISNDVLSFTQDKIKGREVMNTIIPNQEGTAIVRVASKLGDKKLVDVKKKVVVCPAFDSDLLLFKNISLVKATKYALKIDFGDEACSKDIVYESGNSEIFNVNNEGQILALKPGQSVLTIKKGSKEMFINVYITDKPVEISKLSFLPNKLEVEYGDRVRLKLDCEPYNATNGNIMFSSSDESIVTVSDGGLVEAKNTGTAKITATTPFGNKSAVTEVIVTNRSDQGGSVSPKDISLNKTDINLIQGSTEKLLAVIIPNSANNQKLTWKSANEKVAIVNQNGEVFAVAEGKTNIIVSTNNNVKKTIKVNVTRMNKPSIVASDKIATNRWHSKPYTLSFSGADNGKIYYYGNSAQNMTNVGNKITISRDENVVYYVKICSASCQQNCKDNYQDDKKISECINNCDSNPVVCSSATAYVSKLDITMPEVTGIVGIDTHNVKKDTVQIAFKDNLSLVNKWCVTTTNSISSCKWNSIQSASGQVINYTVVRNGVYYAFVKDAAGNVSDSKSFEITNIS